MKTLVKWSLTLIAAVLLSSLALLNLGEVSLRWDVWHIDTSVTFVLALLIVLFVIAYLLIRSWLWLISIPAVWRNHRRIKRYQQAETSLVRGLIAQESADWSQAEKQLIKTAKLSQNGLMHYLTAAKMAAMQQAEQRRDNYLKQAKLEYPEQSLTIGLVEARLSAEKDPALATVILAELHKQYPKHQVVLQEYVQLLRQLKQLVRLREMIPVIKQNSGLSRQDLAQLETDVLAMQLAQSLSFSDLEQQWQDLTSKQKLNPQILVEYIKAAIKADQLNGLNEWIEKAIKAQWDESLIYYYGRIQFGPAYDRLKKAQAWLKNHPDSAVLYLTLGRLACQSQLWGQAHDYFKQSLKLQPELETFHAFAQCYEAEGEERQAALVYKQAMLELDKPKKDRV
ncbi:heme biosynthesis HemY N-terminal domain-containing protein [Thiomicrospira sp. R3]|uniref:heme biosynthesis HemY N-terminal domain-containing protein n=1 Tax=Thiomicrospira sp. R3 TaxID=3035472 RepID=UPI00259B5382|nr:heme biosynthesis HemY N-terminal domain-containing protein [Thiomicrospira sp. R3]WFE69608.1 heme biosynthesis HemY N-terminal domain-containing protein [Thiomicrospira sp. R3]